VLTGENRSVRKRTDTVQVRPPQTLYGPTWYRTRVSAVQDRQCAFTMPSQRRIVSLVQAILCHINLVFMSGSSKIVKRLCFCT
jgi:hypothetical protein